MNGKVEAFDGGSGLGAVRAPSGDLYQFHCTELTDGSRQVDPGTEVCFLLAPGHLGTWEARAVEPKLSTP